MRVLTSLDTYQIDPYDVWKRIKFRSDKPRRCAILREIAAWRETEAQRANLPRGRILKDETLGEIASHAPDTVAELSRVRGLGTSLAEGRYGVALLEAVKKAKALPAEECPKIERKHGLPNGAGAVFDLLKVLLHQVSDAHGVAAKLIASSDDLEEIAASDAPEAKPLQGWRRELFGETALALKAGKLALVVKDKKIELIKI
jgi:ribonuclease D